MSEPYKVVILEESRIIKTCIIKNLSLINSFLVLKLLSLINLLEKYGAMTKILYKDIKAVIPVYDIRIIKSFDELKEYWYEQLK